MLRKKDLQPVIKDFKAKIIEIGNERLVIEIPDERHEELKLRLQGVINLRVDTKSVKKIGGKNVVEFSLTPKTPSEEILDVFSKYYEGTMPTAGYED